MEKLPLTMEGAGPFLIRSDSGLSRNTRGSGYRCSVPGLAGFTEPALCGARSLMEPL